MQSADVTATFCATLVDEWVALGITRAFLAPGSRSTPMALALADDSRVALHVFHDERSAAFAGLGAAKATGMASLLLCTSGTAAVNFHAAVVEASHDEVPILVLTADRPPELQGVGAPQTIDQQHLYGSATRRFMDAGIADDLHQDHWRTLAREAFTAAHMDRPGPVHINLPFREPLVGKSGVLPARTKSGVLPARTSDTDAGLNTATDTDSDLWTAIVDVVAECSTKRGVIVVGARGPTTSRVVELSTQLGWPILADPTSNCRGDDPFIHHADSWLRDERLARSFRPEVVLRFGALHASKVVGGWMRDSEASVTTVTRSSFLIDPDRRTTRHLVGDPDEIAHAIAHLFGASAQRCDGEWLQRWTMADHAARAVVDRALSDEAHLSEPGTARTVARVLPEGSTLVVSSSMPIRDLEWYAGDTSHLMVLANRGANGIDGVTSTAIGAATTTTSPTCLLIGDVAFLHDSSALVGVVQRGIDLRMVVIDNRGGGIFSFLPQRSMLPGERFERLFGTPHQTDLAVLAASHGIPACVVTSSRELSAALTESGVRLILVRTDRQENVEIHDRLHRWVIEAVGASIT